MLLAFDLSAISVLLWATPGSFSPSLYVLLRVWASLQVADEILIGGEGRGFRKLFGFLLLGTVSLFHGYG
jgi:hypothetical protein